MTPDADIATQLQTAGVGTLGSTLFSGPVRPPSSLVPHAAVFCLADGGPAPEPYLGGATSIYKARVSIYVRGNVGAESTARTLARTALASIQVTKPTGYIRVDAEQSEPQWLGYDDTDHPIFLVSCLCWKEQA